MSKTVFPAVPREESPIFAEYPLVDFTPVAQAIARSLNWRDGAMIEFPYPQIDEWIHRMKANLSPLFDIALDDCAAEKKRGERQAS